MSALDFFMTPEEFEAFISRMMATDPSLRVSTQQFSIVIGGTLQGMQGAVEVAPPERQGNALIMGSMRPRESEDGSVDHASRALFRRLAAQLRVHLRSPVWARNVKYGGVAEYRDLFHSQGAAEWAEGGHDLIQRDVENVRFEVKRPTASVG
jgi:hypothetical protein